MEESCHLLTIAIPTYNRGDHLDNLIQAVLYQLEGRNDVDLLICDNASQDHTAEIVDGLMKNSNIMRYHRNDTNIGINGNVYTAYHLAKGKYVWFLADDDTILDGAVESIINVIKSKNPQVMTLYASSVDDMPNEETIKTSSEFFSWTDDDVAGAFLRTVLLPIIVVRKVNLDNEMLLAKKSTVFPQVTLCLELLKQIFIFVQVPIVVISRNPGVKCRNLFELYCLELRSAIRLANWPEAEKILMPFTEVNLKDFVRLQICERAGILISTCGLPLDSWKKGWDEYGGRLYNRVYLIIIYIISRSPKTISKLIYILHLCKKERSMAKALDLYKKGFLACINDQRASDV